VASPEVSRSAAPERVTSSRAATRGSLASTTSTSTSERSFSVVSTKRSTRCRFSGPVHRTRFAVTRSMRSEISSARSPMRPTSDGISSSVAPDSSFGALGSPGLKFTVFRPVRPLMSSTAFVPW
jgi:hypothetical protein